MPYASNGKNSMLDHLATEAVFASLHDNDPGDNGANELSGGSPAYARKAITWNPAGSGIMTASNAPVFDVGAGKTVKYVGFWSLVSGGTFYGSADVTDEVFAAQGTYTLTTTTLNLNA